MQNLRTVNLANSESNRDSMFFNNLSDLIVQNAKQALDKHGFIGIRGDIDAPCTLVSLKAMYEAEKGLHFVVYSGGNDKTIYANSDVNMYFRAWHDLLHIELNAPFNAEGEKMVCDAQIAALPAIYKTVMDLEINGQVKYFDRWLAFPTDQKKFIKYAMVFGLEFAINQGM